MVLGWSKGALDKSKTAFVTSLKDINAIKKMPSTGMLMSPNGKGAVFALRGNDEFISNSFNLFSSQLSANTDLLSPIAVAWHSNLMYQKHAVHRSQVIDATLRGLESLANMANVKAILTLKCLHTLYLIMKNYLLYRLI